MLRVRKKTLVPTKRQLLHNYRSDWILVGVVTYEESPMFFSNIRLDSQFAYWLKSNFGTGIFSIIAWKKGRRGFWNFMKVECTDDGYKRLPKPESSEKKERRDLKSEKNKLKRKLKKEDELGDEQKKMIKDNLEDLEEDISLYKELDDMNVSSHGYSPYLRTILPVFKLHEYNAELRQLSPEEEKENYNLWDNTYVEERKFEEQEPDRFKPEETRKKKKEEEKPKQEEDYKLF